MELPPGESVPPRMVVTLRGVRAWYDGAEEWRAESERVRLELERAMPPPSTPSRPSPDMGETLLERFGDDLIILEYSMPVDWFVPGRVY